MDRKIYKPKEFLRFIDVELLEVYLKLFNIQLPNDLNKVDVDVGLIVDYLDTIDAEIKEKIELGFVDINQMSTEKGVASILELASGRGIHLQDKISKLENNYNQALYFYLNCKELFEDCLTVGIFEYLSSKSEKIHRLKIPIEEVTKKETIESLSLALSDYFIKEDGRGEICLIDVYPEEDKVYFHANLQDYLKSTKQYEPDQSLKRRTVKTVFELTFIYYPLEGKIDLSVKGGKKRQNELFNIFNSVVLKDPNPVPETEQTYNFNRLIQEDFKMPTKPEDEVSYVFLKSIRLTHKVTREKRITFEVEKNVLDGTADMQSMIHETRLNLERYNVTQAVIKIKFPGAGNKGSVTMKLTYPDKCDLNDTKTHIKAREYIKYWGLDLNDYGENR